MLTNSSPWMQRLVSPGAADVHMVVLVLLLIVAAAIDVRTMRIPNWLTVTGAVMGLGLSAAIPWQELGPRWALDGFLWALGGMAAGLVLLLPLYALHVMGAGDVKLMGMVGAFVGMQQIVPTVLPELLGDPDPGKANRVMEAMLQMNKIDIEGLKRAYRKKDLAAAA